MAVDEAGAELDVDEADELVEEATVGEEVVLEDGVVDDEVSTAYQWVGGDTVSPCGVVETAPVVAP